MEDSCLFESSYFLIFPENGKKILKYNSKMLLFLKLEMLLRILLKIRPKMPMYWVIWAGSRSSILFGRISLL